MAEKYYANLKIEGLSVEQVKEKAIGFVYVPAQVVSEYLRKSRVVQWVVPNSIQTESIEMVEVERTSSPQNLNNDDKTWGNTEATSLLLESMRSDVSPSPATSSTKSKPRHHVDDDDLVLRSENQFEEGPECDDDM